MSYFDKHKVYDEDGIVIGEVLEYASQPGRPEGVLLWRQLDDNAHVIHRTHASILTGSGQYIGPWNGADWHTIALATFAEVKL